MSRIKNLNQHGLAHLGLLLVAIVVLAAIGFAGWRVMESNKSKDSSVNNSKTDTSKATDAALQSSELAAFSESECLKEYSDDKILCGSFKAWAEIKSYSVQTTSTVGGETSISTMQIDGENTYMKSEGALAYEIITVDGISYTKAGDTWWKQAATPTSGTPADSTPTADDFQVDIPETETEAASMKYIRMGEEACGNLTCVKYKLEDAANTETVEYLWIDTKDLMTRKMRSEYIASGEYTEMAYDYNKVSVTTPSPVKELGPNQYIMPGATEPTDISAMLEGATQ